MTELIDKETESRNAFTSGRKRSAETDVAVTLTANRTGSCRSRPSRPWVIDRRRIADRSQVKIRLLTSYSAPAPSSGVELLEAASSLGLDFSSFATRPKSTKRSGSSCVGVGCSGKPLCRDIKHFGGSRSISNALLTEAVSATRLNARAGLAAGRGRWRLVPFVCELHKRVRVLYSVLGPDSNFRTTTGHCSVVSHV